MTQRRPIRVEDGDLAIRSVRWEDCENLYQWRMSDRNRRMFRDTTLVPYRAHEDFVRAYLQGDTPDVWFVIECAGVPVGSTALYGFSSGGGECQSGRTIIAADHQRRGYAVRAIRLVFQYAKAAGVQTVRAVVAEDNPASLGLVRALGYVKSKDTVRGGRLFTTFRVVL